MGVLTHERRRTTNVSSFVIWLPRRCQRRGTWYLCQKRKRRGVSTYLGWRGRCASLPSDVARRHALSATDDDGGGGSERRVFGKQTHSCTNTHVAQIGG